jgi:hypothetical protein
MTIGARQGGLGVERAVCIQKSASKGLNCLMLSAYVNTINSLRKCDPERLAHNPHGIASLLYLEPCEPSLSPFL